MRRAGSFLKSGQERPTRASALGALLAASAALASSAALAEERARLPPPIAVERAPAEQRVGPDRFEARSPVTLTFGLDGVLVSAGVSSGAGLSLWAGARFWTGTHLNLGVVAGGTFVSGPATIDLGSPSAHAGLVRFAAARVELFSERDGFYPAHALYVQAGPAWPEGFQLVLNSVSAPYRVHPAGDPSAVTTLYDVHGSLHAIVRKEATPTAGLSAIDLTF